MRLRILQNQSILPALKCCGHVCWMHSNHDHTQLSTVSRRPVLRLGKMEAILAIISLWEHIIKCLSRENKSTYRIHTVYFTISLRGFSTHSNSMIRSGHASMKPLFTHWLPCWTENCLSHLSTFSSWLAHTPSLRHGGLKWQCQPLAPVFTLALNLDLKKKKRPSPYSSSIVCVICTYSQLTMRHSKVKLG